jgi:hypothetical protein
MRVFLDDARTTPEGWGRVYWLLRSTMALGILFGACGQRFAAASDQDTSCARLQSAVATHEHRKDDLYCIPYQDTRRYRLLQLHEKVDPAIVPSGWFGSDLVGYYAVSKRGTCVREWDLPSEKPGRRIAGYCTAR